MGSIHHVRTEYRIHFRDKESWVVRKVDIYSDGSTSEFDQQSYDSFEDALYQVMISGAIDWTVGIRVL